MIATTAACAADSGRESGGGCAVNAAAKSGTGKSHVIKVMYLLKRADNLSLAEFRTWWLKVHMPDIKRRQAPYLVGYQVNIRNREKDDLAGRPKEEAQWDGVAELWYKDAAALEAAYEGPAAQAGRADTLAHVSHMQRLIVDQTNVIDMDK